MTSTAAPDDVARPSDSLLHVAEVIDRTFQGEGPSRGRLATFVRLGGCNLHCTWGTTRCDADFTWDASRYDLRQQISAVDVDDVVARVRAANTPLLVLTGGEPLLHQGHASLRLLLAAAADLGMTVEIETNGTLAPRPHLPGHPHFNVSPKLGNSTADPAERRLVPAALAAFADLARQGRAVFKFVATAPADLDEAAAVVDTYRVPARAVWVMPEGIDPDEITARARALADPVLHRGWNLTLRDHRTLWPDAVKGR